MRDSCVRHGKEHRSRTSIRKESEGRGGDRVKCTGSHVRLEIKPCASGSEEGCKLQPERTPPQPPLLIIRCGMPAPCRWFQSLLTPPLCSAPGNASAVWSHCWHCVLAFGLCPAPRASLLQRSPTDPGSAPYTMAARLHKPLKQSQQGFLSLYSLRTSKEHPVFLLLKSQGSEPPYYLRERHIK